MQHDQAHSTHLARPMNPTRRGRKGSPTSAASSRSLMQKSTEMGMAVPQVVAHRVARMAMAGPVMSSRDRAEFELMWAEKNQAFVQSWQAMSAQALRAQQAMALSWTAALFNPFALGKKSLRSAGPSAGQAFASGMGILNAGLAPVHRKAVANAKRLGRTRLK